MTDVPATITFDEFTKVELRVARVLEAFDHPNADKLIVLKIDLGTEQRQICAGLRGHYEAASLAGRLIVVVANLAPRMMRGQESKGMLLAASDAEHTRVILLKPDVDIEPGSRVSQPPGQVHRGAERRIVANRSYIVVLQQVVAIGERHLGGVGRSAPPGLSAETGIASA